MSGTQWENLPEPVPQRAVPPVGASWQGFSVDPRPAAHQDLRASDGDRDYASRVLDQALADGRLAASEHQERRDRLASSRTFGELVPLVSDLMVPIAGSHQANLGMRLRRAGALGWVGLAILFNAIWLMTSLTAGRPLYYWPMWPMFGIGIPVVIGLISGWGSDASRPRHRPPASGPPPQLPPGPDLR